MKIKKITLILIALLISSLCLSACGDTAPGETTPAETTGVGSQYMEYPEIDYMSLDLSNYLTLGQYKGLTIDVPKKPGLGVELDEEANSKRGEDMIISTANSKVKVMVLPTNEELKIAQETEALI